MDSRSTREREIFANCLELPPDRRAEFVREQCGDDVELCERLQRLLAAHDRAQALTGRFGDDASALDEEIEDPETIGPFRILERLGEGGMGIVYAAEQTEPVRRRVAIKLIKLGMDTREVLARFDSERQAMALMNHPNIARMYDAGATDSGRPYFVMEYVQGEPLTEYCDRERLSTVERLGLFLEVCNAVHHAHQRGVIHRDLKPSNVLVGEQDGDLVCKIIDFGVAKAIHQKLTEVTLHTQAGGFIGTPEYMSPEQVEATPGAVDTRSDVYSLGVLLYELLAGGRPLEFQGSDKGISAIRQEVRERLPEAASDRAARLVDVVPAVAWRRNTTPAGLVRTLRGDLDWITSTALAKEPRRRYQSVRELAEDVRRHLADRPLQARPRVAWYRARKFLRRHRVAVAVAGGVLLAAALGAWLLSAEIATRLAASLRGDDPPLRLTVPITPGPPLWLGSTRSLAIAPNADRIAYVAPAEGGTYLYVRPIDAWDSVRVSGSRGARMPFFSSDGEWLGFFARGELRRVRADASTASEVIVELGMLPRGVSWGADDRIAYSMGPRGIYVVPATGGQPEQLTVPAAERGEIEHQWPHWLPDGAGLLFTATRQSVEGVLEEIAVLPPGAAAGQERIVLTEGAQPAYVASGHVVYANAGTLETAAFDPATLRLTGPRTTVGETVRAYPAPYAEGATYFDVAANGSLLFVPPPDGAAVRLDWVDLDGRVLEPVELPGVPGWPRISPDGRLAAVHVGAPDGRNVWILDLDRPGSLRQLTTGGGGFPVWSPDGARMAFTSRRAGSTDIYVTRVDGSTEPELLVSGERTQIPVSWSRDGVLAYYEVAGVTQRDIWTVDVDGGEPEVFVRTPANELGATFSPDGTAIAYVSNETGREEVYLRRYPPPGAVLVVSIDGGGEPVWSPDGSRLFYRHEDGIMSVEVSTWPELSAGRPELLLRTRMEVNSAGNASFDIAASADRFLMLRAASDDVVDNLRLIMGWQRELRALSQETDR